MKKKLYQAPEINVIELDSEILMMNPGSLGPNFEEFSTEDGPGYGGIGGGSAMSSRSRLGGWDD